MGMMLARLTRAWPARAPSGRGSRVAIGDEALLDRPRDRLLEHPLDAAQQVGLVDADERDRLARRARPAGPADPVDVVLRVPRQLEVDDVRQVLDVEAAGGDVGRDEDPDLAGLEALERARPLRLRAVASGSPRRRGPRGRAALASRVAASLVRVKTSTWRRSSLRIRWARSASLRSRSTG